MVHLHCSQDMKRLRLPCLQGAMQKCDDGRCWILVTLNVMFLLNFVWHDTFFSVQHDQARAQLQLRQRILSYCCCADPRRSALFALDLILDPIRQKRPSVHPGSSHTRLGRRSRHGLLQGHSSRLHGRIFPCWHAPALGPAAAGIDLNLAHQW